MTYSGVATSGHLPKMSDGTGLNYGDGYAVVTSLGNPGSNSNIPSEAAVRAAVGAASNAYSGHFYPFGGSWGSNTNTGGSFSATINQVYYYRFTAPGAFSLKSIVGASGASSTSTHLAFAIMDSTCTKVAGSDKNITRPDNTDNYMLMTYSSPVALAGGQEYYLAIVGEAAYHWFDVGYGTNWFQFSGITDKPYASGSNAPTGSGASLAVPATCGALSVVADTTRPIIILDSH